MKPVLGLFGEVDDTKIYGVISAYFTALIASADERSLRIDITAPIVFRAMLVIFPDIVQRVRDKFGTNYSPDNFAVVLREMFKGVKPSSVKQVGNSVTAYAKVFTDGLKTKTIF
jgi:hypothetical protein